VDDTGLSIRHRPRREAAGAGTGTISERLAPLAEKLTIVEPSANLAAVLRAKFRDDSKVEVAEASLEQHTVSIGDASVDTVVMVNVLEHIENDRGALFQLCRMLRADGHLLIFVPALRGLMSKLDLLFGHFRRYHRTELAEKVAQAGGEVQLCRYFDFLGVLPWFLLNKIMGATTFNPQLVHIHDKFLVPVSAAAERVISRRLRTASASVAAPSTRRNAELSKIESCELAPSGPTV
jgi:SAM-dependent methyltransferase